MIDRFERFLLTISDISRHWHKIAAEELSKYGLKGPHAIYLTIMYRYPDGITVPQLCELCGKDKSDASRMISLLKQKGLVTKQVVDGSLYRGLVKLTKEGQTAAEHVREGACRAVEMVGSDLTEEMRENFYQSLESIATNLKKLSKEGIPKS